MSIHFTNNDWWRVKQDWMDWWAEKLDHPLVSMFAFADQTQDWNSRMFQVTEITSPDSPLEQILADQFEIMEKMRWFGCDFPKFFPNYGPGIIAGFLGATPHIVPGTVWFEPLPVDTLAEIQPHFDPQNLWWRRIYDLTGLAAERWSGQVAVAHTDIGGNLDILAHMRGTERLLTDLTDSPEEVLRINAQITRLWLRYYDELYTAYHGAALGTCSWGPLWAPGRYYMLQSDFSYMISPRMFTRFALPDLRACCDALDYPFYHLDGPGQLRHLDILLAIPNLRGIQWIPGAGQPPADEWLDVLKRIRAAGKLCQVYVSRQGALNIIRALGWKGFCFAIKEDKNLTTPAASDFMKELE
jgi:hypothetical protein